MLEKLIQENTEAINANTQALVALLGTAGQPPKPAAGKKDPKPALAPAPEAAAEPEVPAGPTEAEFIAEAQKLLDQNDTSGLTALAKKYGVKRLRETVGTDKAVAAFKDLQDLVAKSNGKNAV